MIVNGNIIKEVLVEEMIPLAQRRQLSVCFVQFGDDNASKSFIAIKMKVAGQLGIVADIITSDAQTTEIALQAMQQIIAKAYDGIVVQLPLPAGIDAAVIINSIPVAMDIDVLSVGAIEAFKKEQNNRLPPVAAAVETILKVYNVSPVGKKIVIRGQGVLVGQPVMMLFDRSDVRYDVIDKDTDSVQQQQLLQQADIIISGTGVAHSLTPDMIKEGVVLIDAGTTEQTGKLVGDIDPACAVKAMLYTPVPGGVGPITVACLFKNLFV